MFLGDDEDAGAGASNAATHFGQRDAAMDLRAAIQNLQSPQPLTLETPGLEGSTGLRRVRTGAREGREAAGCG